VNDTPKGRYVVLWSGGADSTLVLNDYSKVSSEGYPLIALSITGHPNLHGPFVKAQNAAQKRYLKFAKRKGYHIKHYRMKVGGNFVWGGDHSGTAQPTVWLGALAHVIGHNDTVLAGYTQNDGFWHFNHQFREAFKAICALKELKGVTIEFPLEYTEKKNVLRRLVDGKIPASCWFSCDSTRNSKPCGRCSKCEDIKEARKPILLSVPKKKRRKKRKK
jgi:7-cyano-7-deazaguanine synthase in queuosine biosynthesis